jgi:hypothetical protein
MAGSSDHRKDASPESTLVDDDTGPSTDMTPMTPEALGAKPAEATDPSVNAARLRQSVAASPATPAPAPKGEAHPVPWPEERGVTQPRFEKSDHLAKALDELQGRTESLPVVGRPAPDVTPVRGVPANPAATLVEGETSVGPEPKPRLREGERPTGMRSNRGALEPGEQLGGTPDPRTQRTPHPSAPHASATSADSGPGSRVTLDSSDEPTGDRPAIVQQPPTTKSMTYADSPNALDRHGVRSGSRPLVEPDTSLIPGPAKPAGGPGSGPKPVTRPSGSRAAVAPPAMSPRPSVPPPPPPGARKDEAPASTLTDDSGSVSKDTLGLPADSAPPTLKPQHPLGDPAASLDSTPTGGNPGLKAQQTNPGFDGVRPTNPFTMLSDLQFRRGLMVLGAGVVALLVLVFVWFAKLADVEATDPGVLKQIPHAKEAPAPKPTQPLAKLEPARVVVEQTVDAGHGESRTVLAAAGTVRIVTDPDTNVFVDGKDFGPQPVLITLPVGKQSVLLRNDKLGFKRTVSVDVVPNELTAVRFAFSMGWIEIDAPDGARVSIDGKATTGRHIQVWEGTHKVEVTHSDKKHSHSVQTAEVTASMTTSVHFEAPSIADE